MRTSSKGISFIKAFEGFPNHGCPYRDPVGIWTRGYGRIEGIHATSPCISEPNASRELADLLTHNYEPAVNRAVHDYGLHLGQLQYDALVSVVYNLGVGIIFGDHTLAAQLRRRNYQGAADAILLYDKAGGRTLPGLTRRRQAERAMFLSHESKTERLKAELARIRFKVRKHGGWRTVPEGHYWKRRADSIKRWLAKH